MSPSSDSQSFDPPLDPHAAQPGDVFHAAADSGPSPLVSDDMRADTERRPAATDGVPRRAFLAVVVYASAITAVCLGLLYMQFAMRESPLESLPDIVPPRDVNGNVSRILVPPDAPLPAGHTLALGETRRFGDLLVTPLRITREPLEFIHYRGEGARGPTGEVLKLWLKFENVSATGKSFAPLDADLLFYRTDGERPKANNHLSAKDDRSPEKLVRVYDHPPGSDWDLAGQNLGTVLSPGESMETFVPTTVDPPQLQGTLIWRLQIRKGIAKNGWGVTTLVEVEEDDARKT